MYVVYILHRYMDFWEPWESQLRVSSAGIVRLLLFCATFYKTIQ